MLNIYAVVTTSSADSDHGNYYAIGTKVVGGTRSVVAVYRPFMSGA